MITSSCADLGSPPTFQLVLSILIFLGIFASYIPQQHRIFTRRTSEGISPYFILLGVTSATCAFVNILLLQRSQHSIQCCRANDVSGLQCFAAVLGIGQLGIQWLSFIIIMLLFVIFYPKHPPKSDPHRPLSSPNPPFYIAILIVAISIIHLLIIFIISVVFLKTRPTMVPYFAAGQGVCATILSSLQYWPQLWTTWRLKRAGSLSIPMMCIQTPGAFVLAASLISRLGKEGWSVWGIFLVTGMLQGTLLVMAVVFERRARTEQAEAEERDTGPIIIIDNETDDEGYQEGAQEDTPLLRTPQQQS